jgi:hypothetical protein
MHDAQPVPYGGLGQALFGDLGESVSVGPHDERAARQDDRALVTHFAETMRPA